MEIVLYNLLNYNVKGPECKILNMYFYNPWEKSFAFLSKINLGFCC